ncbi:subtilisin-like protease SBT1.7 [Zingiber officinale]|uniref:subtilisin-like protease SBT1.7 n=1 Tax=Zingiber officinale TaxID=94328 RepID=UPI001C4AC7E3|nr:subtilisin-like protease SBT1.7 [Zingiber officinale]
MGRQRDLLRLILWLVLFCCSAVAGEKGTYIVHMAKSQLPPGFAAHRHWYDASLRSVSDSADAIYYYDTVAHGFAARLSPAEARALSRRHGVLSVTPETRYELHTTRTPEFLGLVDRGANGFLDVDSPIGDDVVVGVLDTGVWPERRSFDDAELGPVPESWKGECEDSEDFPAVNCNRKLVGARSFFWGYKASVGTMEESKETRSPRDRDGHGTHTASTVAGAAVPDASLFGFAAGTARGMSPRARVAVYKVCWLGGCFGSDILAGIDKAVEDGCGVLSLSLGGKMVDYFRDTAAIGAFGAMEKGVFVSCSAGNAGPVPSSLSNVAPWMTTVGAGTLDRDFPAYVMLGNGENYTGVTLYRGPPLPPSPTLPLIYAANASEDISNGNLCLPGTLSPEKVAGKIVVCDRGINPRVQKGYVVHEAGGAGMVLANSPGKGEELVADAHLLPAAGTGEKAGNAIKAYILSDPNPTATVVFGGTKVGVQPSPVVAAFSSRGPNSVTRGVLKPDIIAPGVNILAAWTDAVGPTGIAVDSRRVEFNIVSGTSMSCPHVSGLAAFLKGAHPEWSPAAIRSALMTTAYSAYAGGDALLDAASGRAATPFDLGAGHVEPRRAMDPGLVYDLTAEDYLDFLCALNYSAFRLAILARRSDFACDAARAYAVEELNYPSFAVTFPSSGGEASVSKHRRTLTNVGEPGTYKVTVTASAGAAAEGVKVEVVPEELIFGVPGEKRNYTVSFSSSAQPQGSSGFGRLEWSDGKHVVSSPVAFVWV